MRLMTAHAIRDIFQVMGYVLVRSDFLPACRNEAGRCRNEFLEGAVALQTAPRCIPFLRCDRRRLGPGRFAGPVRETRQHKAEPPNHEKRQTSMIHLNRSRFIKLLLNVKRRSSLNRIYCTPPQSATVPLAGHQKRTFSPPYPKPRVFQPRHSSRQSYRSPGPRRCSLHRCTSIHRKTPSRRRCTNGESAARMRPGPGTCHCVLARPAYCRLPGRSSWHRTAPFPAGSRLAGRSSKLRIRFAFAEVVIFDDAVDQSIRIHLHL